MKENKMTKGTEVALLIRQLCKDKNITVQHLEEVCDIGNGSIKRWENGQIPKVTSLITIADYFDITMDYLTLRNPNDDTINKWNTRFNAAKLAEEVKLYNSLNKVKDAIESYNITKDDLEALKEYIKILNV